MEETRYDFQVGEIACTSISDGQMVYGPPMLPPPTQLLFPSAPKDRLNVVLADLNVDPEQWPEWVNPYTCLLVNTGDHRVLVETGAGGLAPETGKLLQGLGAAGLGPEDIDLIVLTHAHYDHLGGNTDAEGKVLFENARWIMSATEWHFWMDGEAERAWPADVFPELKAMTIGIAQQNLGPLKDRVRLVQGQEEIIPGLEVISTPGHTPGHLAVVVSSNGEKLFCLGDICLHEGHMREPDWAAAFDMVPPLVAGTRRSILAEATQEKARVMAYHFPFPAVGRVSPIEAGWRWLPEA
jgi:glyoxylase-like metal-dependent hydrolase (beta-lactamase superfamily II)